MMMNAIQTILGVSKGFDTLGSDVSGIELGAEYKVMMDYEQIGNIAHKKTPGFMFLVKYGLIPLPGRELAQKLYDNITHVFGDLEMTMDCYELPKPKRSTEVLQHVEVRGEGEGSGDVDEQNEVTQQRDNGNRERSQSAQSGSSGKDSVGSYAVRTSTPSKGAGLEKRFFLHCRPIKWVADRGVVLS